MYPSKRQPDPAPEPAPKHTVKYVVHGSVVFSMVVLSVVVAMASSGVIAGTPWSEPRPHLTLQEEQEIDPVVYTTVSHIRSEVALTARDLAALNLSKDQSQEVLARLLAWVQSNGAALGRVERQATTARNELRELERKVRTGEANEREIGGMTDLRQALSQADDARQKLFEQAGMHATANLNRETQTQWQGARHFCDLPLEIRHLPGLDKRRLLNLMKGLPNGMQGVKAEMTYAEQQATETIGRRVQAKLSGVQRAEAEVLPQPQSDEDAVSMFDEDEVAGGR